MKRPLRGAFTILMPIAVLAGLGGCASTMSQRQAVNYATDSLNRYCTQTAPPCGSRRATGAQRLKQGWLVDFDSAAARYGVMVHDNRATEVSVWKKGVGGGG